MPQEPFQLSVGSAQGLNKAFMVEVNETWRVSKANKYSSLKTEHLVPRQNTWHSVTDCSVSG